MAQPRQEVQVYEILNFPQAFENMASHPNDITLVVTIEKSPSQKYVFKLTQRGTAIQVEKFVPTVFGGFLRLDTCSKCDECYMPILTQLTRPNQNSTLYAKLKSIIQSAQPTPAAAYYLKIGNVLAIETDNQPKITNPLTVPFCMANIDTVLERVSPNFWLGGAKNKQTTSKPKLTSEKVTYNSRKHSVYLGPKGGKYIKKSGEFISLAKLSL